MSYSHERKGICKAIVIKSLGWVDKKMMIFQKTGAGNVEGLGGSMGNFFKNSRFVLVLAGAVLLAACASIPNFEDVRNKQWKLVMVQTKPENIILDRNQLEAEGFGDAFTINFADQVSGKGAPNRYFGPYEAGKDLSLSIKNVASTLMAPIREPETLKEREFFKYLENAHRWNINQGNLEISTSGEDGVEAVMVFVLE
jgi:heat shock protein HslJ